MKFSYKSYFIPLAVSFLFLSACNDGQPSTPEIIETGLKSTLTETLDNYLSTNIAENSAGMAIRVIKDNETVYTGARGAANIYSGQKIDSDTGFRIGSISKTFTALAIMQLMEQSLLTPEDSILLYLPEFSGSWQGITIHHLLSHQSGIPDFANDMDIQEDWPDRLTNNIVLQFFAKQDALEFTPGSQGSYSNTGYVLLAEIVSRISGLRFGDYLRERIFLPASMSRTYLNDEFLSSSANLNVALNYAQTTELNGREFYVSGASGIVSSIEDMSRFMSSLLAGEIVSMASLSQMQKPYTLQLFSGSNVDYGYGIMVDPNGTDAFLHTGRNDGFSSFMLINRETNSRLLMLGNGGNQTENHSYIQQLIIDFYNSVL